jgi:hypothetical protein
MSGTFDDVSVDEPVSKVDLFVRTVTIDGEKRAVWRPYYHKRPTIEIKTQHVFGFDLVGTASNNPPTRIVR